MKNFQERFLPLRAPDGPAAGTPATPAPASSEPAAAGASAVPAAAAPAEPASTSHDAGHDFNFPSDFSMQDETDETPIVPAESAAAIPAAPAAPAIVPPAAPVAEPVAQPAPAPAAAEPSQPANPTPTAGDPNALAASLDQHRDAAIAHLAQTRFQLNDEEIAELETNAATAVPKLLARAFFESQTQMMRFVAQSIPQMLQQHQQVTSASSAAENKFFESHKELDAKNPQHKQLVAQYATAFRQANPTAKLDDAIKHVGVMVKAMLGIAPGAQMPTVAQPAALPAGAPAPVPFRPAVGASPSATPVPVTDNPWAGMAGNFDEE